jgi:5'(3')-deoxyribonucleotidase
MKVYLDMDGVLYAWNKGIAKMFDVPYDNKAIQEEFAGDYEGLESFIGFDKVEKGIRDAGKKFWLDLELFPWARDVYREAVSYAGDKNVFFLTSFGKWPDSASAKLEVLTRDFKTNPNQVILTKSKHLLAREGSVLVDDKPENLDAFQDHGGTIFRWPHEFSIQSGQIDLIDQIDKLKFTLNRTLNSWG